MGRPSRRGRDVLPCERSNSEPAKKGQEKSGGGGGFVKSDMTGVDMATETKDSTHVLPSRDDGVRTWMLMHQLLTLLVY